MASRIYIGSPLPHLKRWTLWFRPCSLCPKHMATRFEGTLSLEGLRLPLSPFSPWSESRMTVLWLLRKFDCFDARCCRCCGGPIRTQSHVTICGGLSSRLLTDPRLPALPMDQNILPFPVEKFIMASLSQPARSQRLTIHALSMHILACVTAVYGPDAP